MSIHNFYAGPSIIAPEVLAKASEAILKKDDLLSVIEISHRSIRFGDIMEEARALVKELAKLDDDFEVLFLQGGGRQQFFQVPFNLLSFAETACYIDTGSWAHQAIKEALFFGKATAVASSRENEYRSIPKQIELPEKAAYLHITTNNTIYGTQFHTIPECKAPIVADMSSDLFCRELDYNKFGLVYSAAQKNAGTAGATLVMVRKSILKKEVGSLPTMIDYQTHINKASLYNTPPVFAVYMSLLVLRWIKEQGGLSHFGKLSKQRAELLYQEIDRNPLFEGHAVAEDRSVMNAAFICSASEKEAKEKQSVAFLELCDSEGIVGIKGHSSVGGFRASMYNALPLKSVEVLVEVMQAFEQKFG